MDIVKLVAGFAFLVFGLWTLRGDSYDDDGKKKSKFGPVLTVTIAFFFAEMGDKTQLMTIAIAADSNQPLWILGGTTIGMLIADAIGILGGAWMCKNIPDKYMKWIPGLIFLFFGTLTVYEAAPSAWISVPTVLLYLLLLALSIYIVGFKLNHKNSEVIITADGFAFETCPYHHLLPEGKCPHIVLNKDNQCKYNVEHTDEKCPMAPGV
jgi:intracellular septation protein A